MRLDCVLFDLCDWSPGVDFPFETAIRAGAHAPLLLILVFFFLLLSLIVRPPGLG